MAPRLVELQANNWVDQRGGSEVTTVDSGDMGSITEACLTNAKWFAEKPSICVMERWSGFQATFRII